MTAGSAQGSNGQQLGRENTQRRTNSLTNSRLNSLNSNSSRLGSSHNASRSNSLSGGVSERIIITKTQDEYGRTKSITKETIQNFGSFEITKREFLNEADLKPPQAAARVMRTSSLMSNELNSIQEIDEDFTNFDYTAHNNNDNNLTTDENIINENEEVFWTPQSPIKSILKNPESSLPPFVHEEEEEAAAAAEEEEDGDEVQSDGGSIYSDAFEILPSKSNTMKRKQKKRTTFVQQDHPASNQNSRLSSLTSQTSSSRPFYEKVGSLGGSNRLSVPVQRIHQPAAQPQAKISEQEQYNQAYQIALKKVYGDDTAKAAAAAAGQMGKGTMLFKRYSLREDPAGTSQNSKKKEKRLDIDSDEEDKAAVVAAMAAPRSSKESNHQASNPRGFGFRARSSSLSSSSSIFRSMSNKADSNNFVPVASSPHQSPLTVPSPAPAPVLLKTKPSQSTASNYITPPSTAGSQTLKFHHEEEEDALNVHLTDDGGSRSMALQPDNNITGGGEGASVVSGLQQKFDNSLSKSTSTTGGTGFFKRKNNNRSLEQLQEKQEQEKVAIIDSKPEDKDAKKKKSKFKFSSLFKRSGQSNPNKPVLPVS